MTYQETIEYLYDRLPVFQNIGARAFKPGLHTTRELCKLLGDPQDQFPTIHIAGTNGKGSTSHMLAAILQEAGYRVGLYTSPHLKDFRERIRVNGVPVSEDFIVDFIDDQKSNIERLSPSFFEVTVAMAFSYFGRSKVDVAVIEVGMGGRLDSTNVITPELSVITNISFDHMQFLGDTLGKIAAEKAGIIKNAVPVVVSEDQNAEISDVITAAAENAQAPLTFAARAYDVTYVGMRDGLMLVNIQNRGSGDLEAENLALDLTGSYQLKNVAGVWAARKALLSKGWNICDEAVIRALRAVGSITGLKGRWQQLGQAPNVYCDTAHNTAGLTATLAQFESVCKGKKRFVIGFVGDKDISTMLSLFPRDAQYYFCEPSNMRALKAPELQARALECGLAGETFGNVKEALAAALRDSAPTDAIYVGGSTFVVADIENL
ncbi:bifunctional folylpolyglutamate synthase/dihydrofolate synthase [Dyadobacter fermentans]|uniref:Dihydrofolate synthase/folylpolyglutamate synthase n=1 Tax=Dyadobacter fermentans (strain ATCC 700827 / DSM 18053 / CIP 107007 / KCTC 52180 / NS114) TaxID=471854 RepID=C6W460_DYAFD|nr:folylpolyglutamate synthase/dihydrofolate synthase family protein [Dyadobacter fermentans]ACT92297.1 FolC bifunctional protein [Dyadobacter fermentans DSM 18053]